MDGPCDFENWRFALEHLVAIATQGNCDANAKARLREGDWAFRRSPTTISKRRFKFCSPTLREIKAQARRGRVPRRPIGNLAAVRLRHIAGTAWSTKRCLKIQLLGATDESRQPLREPAPGAPQPRPNVPKSLAPPNVATRRRSVERLVVPVKLVTGYRLVSMASQFQCQSEGTRLANPHAGPALLLGLANIPHLCREHKAPEWRFRENRRAIDRLLAMTRRPLSSCPAVSLIRAII